MQQILISIGNFIANIVLSVWFLAIVAVLILVRLGVMAYRRGKLRALGQLEYSRSFSTDGVFVGDSFEFTEVIHNPTLFPLVMVRMDFFVPAGFVIDDVECREYTKISSLFNIPPNSSVTKTHIVRADIRGHYSLETASVRYRGNEFLFSVPFDIYVYPKCTAVSADTDPDLYRAGNSIANRKYIEDPFFLSGIRPYQAGDPMRSINFKASVRSFSGGIRRLMTNCYDSSRHYNSMILLDLTNYGENEEATDQQRWLETGLEYACFLLSETLRHGGKVGFATNCAVRSRRYVSIPCSTGGLHVKNILRCFAEVNYYSRCDFSFDSLILRAREDIDADTDLYIITPYVDVKSGETLRRLEASGVNISFVTVR
ncbi:MAG: DUF58 domain-containing protein [Clostridia bacterium]|nr:DUF58 domain-containing protein [Clostridia bacterium]